MLLLCFDYYVFRGKNGFFEFNQVDFGVQFSPFMRDIISPGDTKWNSHSESLTETNRYYQLVVVYRLPEACLTTVQLICC